MNLINKDKSTFAALANLVDTCTQPLPEETI